MSSPRRKSKSQQVSFSAWLSGTRWGLKMTLGIIISLTSVFVFLKLSNDLGLTRYVLAHRGYVDDEIKTNSIPLKNGVVEIRSQLANQRLNEIDKQIFDIEVLKAKSRNNPVEMVQLAAQTSKLGRERDDILHLLQTLQK